MRALEPEVFDALWEQVEPLLPTPSDDHPLGCHRPRVPDRVCLYAIVVRLVTGCSWVDVERLMGGVVSDTTLRSRRDEWIGAGVFDDLMGLALALYEAKIGLEPADAMVDASLHKAPAGGEGVGKSPVDRGKLGWKWSLATDRNGIPLGVVAAPGNRTDMVLLPATLEAVDDQGLLEEVETLHVDRGYNNRVVRRHVRDLGIRGFVAPPVRRRGAVKESGKLEVPLGGRWVVERTHSWLSNFGQLRRNTDRRTIHRMAQLGLAIALLLIAKLLDQGYLVAA
jgi:transposase